MKSEDKLPHFDHKRSDSDDMPKSTKGHFLISESNMLDPHFFRSVILVIEHNQDGAFGLVVNRRSKLNFGALMPDLTDSVIQTNLMYIGGPVEQEYLFIVHSEMPEGHHSSSGAIELIPGVTFEPSFPCIQEYFEHDNWNNIPIDDRPQVNLYLGYSGWGAGQLEREIKMGSWIVHPAHQEIIFHPEPAQGWQNALRQKGGIYKIFANSKQQPELN